MFGFAAMRIDFDRKIDSVKSILAKIYFKLKWFMFVNIHAKVSWKKKLNVKINSRVRSYLQVESILLLRN
jgi:hypothetical protein